MGRAITSLGPFFASQVNTPNSPACRSWQLSGIDGHHPEAPAVGPPSQSLHSAPSLSVERGQAVSSPRREGDWSGSSSLNRETFVPLRMFGAFPGSTNFLRHVLTSALE